MADARLRELERRAREGTAEDRAAWLRARLQVGTLTRERLELAAYAGDEAARVVVPSASPERCYGVHPGHSQGCRFCRIDEWTRGLYRWGREVQVRGALAAQDVGMAACHSYGLLGVPRTVRAEVLAWLLCPCERHRDACEWSAPGEGPAWAFAPLLVVWARAEDVAMAALLDCVSSAARVAGHPARPDEAAVRAAMQRELVAWALGPT